MHCGVMVTGYNHGDWERLMAGDYSRPPTVPDYVQLSNTIRLGDLVEPLGFDSIWATEHYGSAYSMQPIRCSIWPSGPGAPRVSTWAQP